MTKTTLFLHRHNSPVHCKTSLRASMSRKQLPVINGMTATSPFLTERGGSAFRNTPPTPGSWYRTNSCECYQCASMDLTWFIYLIRERSWARRRQHLSILRTGHRAIAPPDCTMAPCRRLSASASLVIVCSATEMALCFDLDYQYKQHICSMEHEADPQRHGTYSAW